MNNLARFRYVAVAAPAACACLGPPLSWSAGASRVIGRNVQNLKVSFRYQPIEAAVRHSLGVFPGGSDADAASRAALPGYQVSRYLAMVGQAFAAKKHAILARYPGVSLVEDFLMLPVAELRDGDS